MQKKRSNHFRRAQKRKYRTGTFRNPYFEPNKRKPLIFVGVGFVFLAIASGLIYVTTHSKFDISQVNTTGVEHINKETFANAANGYFNDSTLFFFSPRNRFLFRSESLAELLSEKFTFEEIDVERVKDRVKISLVEKTSQLLWYTNDNVFVVDLEGALIQELNKDEITMLRAEEFEPTKKHRLLRSLPKFRDRNDVVVEIGDTVMTPQEIENIFTFHEHLHAQQIPFYETQIDRLAGKWTGVLTQSGYDILFDATGDIEAQATNLDTLLANTQQAPEDLDYIDLRFGDHVYIK